MSDPTKKLVDELCSLLDEATILSISSDYDLEKPDEFTAAREVLLAISKDVEAEEATGFNPSGFSGDDLAGISSLNEGASGAQPPVEGDLKSNDGFTTTTDSSHTQSLMSGSSKTSTQDSPGPIHVDILDHLGDEEKVRQLSAMFVSLKEINIKLVLQKAKGDANLAMDELLNQQWLESTGQRPKGVDGFYVSDEEILRKKKQSRKRAKKVSKAAASQNTRPASPSEMSNREGAIDNENVTFICNWFSLPESEATLIYKRNKFSLGAAILEMLDNYVALGLPSSGGPYQTSLEEEQAKRVPWIPAEYFNPIFDTSSSTQSAVAIIDVLAGHFPKPAYLKYNISYNVAASSDIELLSDASLASGSAVATKSPWKTSASTNTAHTIRQLRGTPTSLEAASTAKAAMAASAKHSYASASSAFKKGKGDPLMRGAAAYFADRARAETANYRQAMSVEAEFLVDRQSTSDTIDLHGVTVQDGVEIALSRAWRWWNGLGEEKLRLRGGGAGGNNRAELRIVTGIGRHNPDGRSPLRTHVFKALVADGWMVEVLTGAFLLKGRRS